MNFNDTHLNQVAVKILTGFLSSGRKETLIHGEPVEIVEASFYYAKKFIERAKLEEQKELNEAINLPDSGP